MPRRKPERAQAQIEEAIRRAGSFGALERLVGIGSTQEAREEFWRPFARLPGAAGLDAGVAELKGRIRAAARAEAVPRRGVGKHA